MGVVGFIFSLIFKQKGSNQSSYQSQQGNSTSSTSGDRFQQIVERTMEQHSLSPAAAEQLLNSDLFKGKMSDPLRARIEQAIEHVKEEQGDAPAANPSTSANPAGSIPTADAWRPDAATTGDANWHPDAVTKGEDPWHPDTKKNDPWNPNAGSKKNDPWHPGD
ncbi:MAG TPA: hypothetical protein VHV31_03050 [Nitrolancea sp.]|jgi:hypothetical protein|nr:hypothetical protein [Nitrolancea sp.]